MANILLATHNQGKIKRYRALFRDIANLKLVTLAELQIYAKVPEPFSTPQENSVHKAREYGRLSGLPTLAIDEAVSTNFLPDHQQPGVLVRRHLQGRELSDREMLAQWQDIFQRFPIKDRQFVWDFCLSYYNPATGYEETVSAQQVDSVAEEFSEIIDLGYPMSSFLIPVGYTRTYSELSADEFLGVDRLNLRPFLEFIRQIVADSR